MNLKPIIFLDIDGVLNSTETADELGVSDELLLTVAPCHVRHLTALLDVTDADVVISSTWRKHHSLAQIVDGLVRRGGMPERHWHRFIDVTPRLWSVPRGQEIDMWLLTNLGLRPDGMPRPYVILDDDSDMLPHQMPHFVQVADGLTEDDALKAWAILEGVL